MSNVSVFSDHARLGQPPDYAARIRLVYRAVSVPTAYLYAVDPKSRARSFLLSFPSDFCHI